MGMQYHDILHQNEKLRKDKKLLETICIDLRNKLHGSNERYYRHRAWTNRMLLTQTIIYVIVIVIAFLLGARL